MIETDSSSEALMNPTSTMPAATVNLSARSTAVSQEKQETTAFDEFSPCPSNSLEDPIPSNMTDATTTASVDVINSTFPASAFSSGAQPGANLYSTTRRFSLLQYAGMSLFYHGK